MGLSSLSSPITHCKQCVVCNFVATELLRHWVTNDWPAHLGIDAVNERRLTQLAVPRHMEATDAKPSVIAMANECAWCQSELGFNVKMAVPNCQIPVTHTK